VHSKGAADSDVASVEAMIGGTENIWHSTAKMRHTTMRVQHSFMGAGEPRGLLLALR
jgi:hypothetical protein